MKIGSFQGISHAHFIRHGTQELQAVKNVQALAKYKAVQGAAKSDAPKAYCAAIVDISQEARDLAAAYGARSEAVDALIKLNERKK